MSELPEKELDSGLRAAFDGPLPDHSVLKQLAAKPLRLSGSETEPATDATGRYQMVGELARGGVGVVYKGRDVDLGRDVAIKVLRDELKEDPSVAERFIEEAQVGGQLQHPGIVPVYEIGLDDAQRPYFAMKLVKGRTLGALLKDGEGIRKLLGVFEKVCETMAYAHARGVVHRDLKPANIMVGAFGEVQIVDWGFAKVLREGGIADERAKPDVSVIATVRSGSEGSESIAGSVMGTPAYMPPEQALGQVEALDESSDVFALGAILFEILTGRKLYEKSERDNLLVLAAQCRLDEQFALLEGHDLEPLLRRCLAVKQSDRPKDASAVERAIASHLASVEERAQAARVAAAEAQVRANAERKKRVLTLALAGAFLLALVLGGGGWWMLEQNARDRAAERTRAAQAAIDEATLLRGQGRFKEALASARRAAEMEDSPEARQAVAVAERALAAAEKVRQQAERFERFASTLRRVFMIDPMRLLPQELIVTYERVFEDVGIPMTDIAAWRKTEGKHRMAAAWAIVQYARARRRVQGKQKGEWEPLLDSLKRLYPDNLTAELVDAVKNDDAEALVRLTRREDPTKVDVDWSISIAYSLMQFGRIAEAASWLRKARETYPDNWHINCFLGACTQGHEAIGALTAALAITPDNATLRATIGRTLARMGRWDEAMELWRDAARVDPTHGYALAEVGRVLKMRGDDAGARKAFADALQRTPDDIRIIWLRADAFHVTDPAQAIEDYRKAFRLRPLVRFLVSQSILRMTTSDETLHDPKEAARLAKQAIQLAKTDPRSMASRHATRDLGYAFYVTGQYKVARTQLDAYMASPLSRGSVLGPCFLAMTHNGLGNEADTRKWLAEAEKRAQANRLLWPGEAAALKEARKLVR